MENIEALEIQKMALYRKLIEHYKSLNLFKDKSNHNKVIQEIIRVYGFIRTLEIFGVRHCLPPKISPDSYDKIQGFLDEKAFECLELTFGKTKLQTVFLDDLEKLQKNTIKANSNTLNICKKRNISFVLPIVKKIDDEPEGFEIDLSIKKKKDIDLDI